jgi:SecD/SecF fusion protein
MNAIVRKWNIRVLRIEPLLRLVPDGTKIQFMKARPIGLAVSAVLSIASVALFFYPGLNYGVDFRGGI